MDVKLPNLGEGADSGTVVNVLVKPGDTISPGQPIVELENEKAVATIPSNVGGTVDQIFVANGQKISVGQKILSVSGGQSVPRTPARSSAPKPQAPEPVVESDADAAEETEPVAGPADADLPASGSQPAASPAIRKIARDLGIDLSRVRGTARGGRIELSDLRAYILRLQKLARAPRAAQAPPAKPPSAHIDFSTWGLISRTSLSSLRQVIARRMSESWAVVPRVTQFDDADITGLLELRKKYAAAYEAHGTSLTLTPFLLKAVVDTLKRHPIFNSSLDDSTHELVLKQYFHIGVAVDTEAGLIVPVIRDVDRKTLPALAKELESIASRARDRKISGEELKGGSFTISNQGSIGGGFFTPIVNTPEVAILGVGRGAPKPVVRDGRIESRVLLPLALSYDHRVIDGAHAAKFIVDLVKALESVEEGNVRY